MRILALVSLPYPDVKVTSRVTKFWIYVSHIFSARAARLRPWCFRKKALPKKGRRTLLFADERSLRSSMLCLDRYLARSETESVEMRRAPSHPPSRLRDERLRDVYNAVSSLDGSVLKLSGFSELCPTNGAKEAPVLPAVLVPATSA